jgi:signal peptidase
MDKLRKIRANKKFKIAMRIIKAFVIVVLVGFIIVVCLQRFSDNKLSFMKYRMFTVISGSMKPKYDIGDVLIAKEVDPSTIKVGDDISYLGRSGSFKDKVITHRVTEIKKDKNGKYFFKAKGLVNVIEDPGYISEDQLYGVIVYKSLMLSTIYRIVATNVGFYLFIIIPILYIIGSEILVVMLEKEEKRRKELESGT